MVDVSSGGFVELRKIAHLSGLAAGAVVLLFAFNNCKMSEYGFTAGQMDLGSLGCKVAPEILVQQVKDGDYHIEIFTPESEHSNFNEKLYLNDQADPALAPRHFKGVIEWYYNPDRAPSGIAATALETLQASTAYWSSVCNIRFNYMGTTTKTASQGSRDGTNVMGWGTALGSTGITFSTMTTSRGLGYIISESDIEFNPAQIRSSISLRGVANHEIGHMVGLAHSDVSESIMYANPYHDIQYLLMLRPDDVAGCVGLYGVPGSTPVAKPTPSSTTSPSEQPNPSAPTSVAEAGSLQGC